MTIVARHIVTTVAVERLHVEHGHWCTACALPSGWLIWLAVRYGTRMHLERRTWCDECGRPDAVVLGEG